MAAKLVVVFVLLLLGLGLGLCSCGNVSSSFQSSVYFLASGTILGGGGA